MMTYYSRVAVVTFVVVVIGARVVKIGDGMSTLNT